MSLLSSIFANKIIVKMDWIKPNTITGPTAEGSKYFSRAEKENKLWRKILTNHHVLFLAPRRVGKSSIVINMAKKPKDGYACLYENIATEGSLQDFYKRLYQMTIRSLSTYEKSKNKVFKWFKSIKVTGVSPDGTLSLDSKVLDYRELFLELLNSIPRGEVKVVLFLDEFPDAVLKVFQNHGTEEAEKLLADIRAFDNEHFKRVFMMVLLGSVGLTHIIKQITGRTDKVNNLHKEYLQALSTEEVGEFISFLTENASMQINASSTAHIIVKTGHLPYYIQLIIEECDEILEENNTPNLTHEVIDRAHRQLIKKNEHFSDWDSRLSKYFPSKYTFLLAVVTKCAHNGYISIQEIANIAKKYKNPTAWKADLDDILIADGYLYEKDETIYEFNSPLLRDWWKNRHPNL
ncbi:MAG: hypothetical protein EAY75_14975 [Bacteroidetes bacterium]|nr:MAG: hypothetical protein EAY75_14975 [Bacteroidota bacterium]